MNNIRFATVAMALVLCFPVMADSANWQQYIPGQSGHQEVYYGPTNLNRQSFENLTIYGPADINECTVTQLADFKGPVKASKSTFQTVHVDGLAKLDRSTVLEEVFINGPLNAEDCKIHSISIASTGLSLTHCKVDRVLVRKNGNSEPQRVYLGKETTVGAITFERGNGQVIMGDPTAVVNDVKGGSVVK